MGYNLSNISKAWKPLNKNRILKHWSEKHTEIRLIHSAKPNSIRKTAIINLSSFLKRFKKVLFSIHIVGWGIYLFAFLLFGGVGERRLLFERVLGLDEGWNKSVYVSVNRWIRALRRRGDRRSTKLAYFKWLCRFLRFLNLSAEEDLELGDRRTSEERREELIRKVLEGLNPDGLVCMSPEEVSMRVQDFCDRLNEAGKARTAHSALNHLRSFFKHNGFENLDLEDCNWRKSRRIEYVPTKGEVYKMAEHCDPRGKAIILCVFQSGLRNATLRALNYGDIKEQLEKGNTIITVKVDSKLRERIPEACKEDAEYYTFFGKEATEALREYIEWRIKKHGRIGEDEPLFAPYEAFSNKPEAGHYLSEDSLQRLIKRAAKRARIKEWKNIRFHSLRKTFRAVLDAGYIDGGQMAEDDKEYLMGHRLPSQKEPYHNANVNVLAERYMKLKWEPEGAMTESAKIEAIKAFARSLGITEIDVKMARIRQSKPNLSEEEALGKIIREELGITKPRPETPQKRTDKDPKKVIEEDELESYLAQGWDVQTVLPSGKILVRKPNI
jgi:integrase